MSGAVLRLRLLALALAVGAVIVISSDTAINLILGKPLFGDEGHGLTGAPHAALLQLTCASLPMIVLALFGVRSVRLWTVAIAATLAFWVYFVIQVWRDWLSGFEGGLNIGLGLIMLASPLLVLVCVGLARLVFGSDSAA